MKKKDSRIQGSEDSSEMIENLKDLNNRKIQKDFITYDKI